MTTTTTITTITTTTNNEGATKGDEKARGRLGYIIPGRVQAMVTGAEEENAGPLTERRKHPFLQGWVGEGRSPSPSTTISQEEADSRL
jgi:hypothetical protein